MTRRLTSCLECGKEFRPRQHNAQFCAGPCRTVFNNRRAMRGVMLYDLTVAAATYPGRADELNELRDQVLEAWREHDAAKGRRRTTKTLWEILQGAQEVLRAIRS